MSDKIKFNWAKFREVESNLSKTEEAVIEEHFRTFVSGNDYDGYSSPEMEHCFNIFRSSWIMCEMFTN